MHRCIDVCVSTCKYHKWQFNANNGTCLLAVIVFVFGISATTDAALSGYAENANFAIIFTFSKFRNGEKFQQTQ